MTQRLIVLIFLNVLAFSAFAQVNPSIEWRTFETEHFELIYDANHQKLAEIYAIDAERAYFYLAPIFNNETPKKTIIVLDDSTDSANGFATAVPRPLINVYPVLPGSLDFLSHYDIWSREMITHEFTHILNMEPTNGFWKPFRFIFGSVIRPNMLLPRWYLEGLAVQTETEFTNHGRLRSPIYKGMVRAQINENLWGEENLSRANEVSIPTWPLGSRPYFYGALLWADITKDHGLEAIGKLNDRYSRRLPYFINSPSIDVTGRDLQEGMNKVYSQQKSIGTKQIEALKKAKSTDSKSLFFSLEGHAQHSPQVSPDQSKLVFINKSVDSLDQIILVSRTSSLGFENFDPKVIRSGLDSVSKVSWFPDSKKIIYDAQDEFDRYFSYSDLYIYEIESKKSKKITKGIRARDPAVSPDGSRIIFVQNLTSQTRLVSVNDKGEDLKVLYEAPLQVRISGPEYVDSKTVIYSERDLSGREYLKQINLETLSASTVLQNFEPVSFPTVTSKGVLFLSSRSGVTNLYVASKDLKSASPITNTTTHIFNGTLDSTTNRVLASRLGAAGSKLEAYEFLPRNESLPEVDPAEGFSWKTHAEPTTYALNPSVKEYSGVSYLFPQYWFPSLFAGPYATAFGASTSGQDPLLKHRYSAEALVDTQVATPTYGFSYTNAQTPVTVGLSVYDQTYALETASSTSKKDFITNHEVWINGIGSFYFPGVSSDWSGNLGWSYFSNQYEGQSVTTQQGPTMGFNYSSLSMRGYQISPSGQSFGASYTRYLPKLGSIDYDRVSADGTYYWTKWLPRYHTLMMSARATYSPMNRSIFRGTTTAGGDYFSSSINQPYVVRGYPLSEFVGWSLLTTTLEYRFPLWYIYNGPGTTPFFARRLHGAVFWDTISLEGAYYNSNGLGLYRSRFGTFFSGYGAEARFDFNLFYYVPLTLRLGYHLGAQAKAYGEGGIYVGLTVPQI